MADLALTAALAKALGGGGGGGGGVSDVKVNGQSVVSDGVADIPVANATRLGVVKAERNDINNTYGIALYSDSSPLLIVSKARDEQIKMGTQLSKPIVPYSQHISAFYGLAKAAGADMNDIASTTVGVYPEAQKSAISQMLSAPETVSGSTPSITAKAGVAYEFGECSTLDVTTPTTGVVDFVFKSGSTPTVLTVAPAGGQSSDMEWPDWFDPTSLEANATYEISVRNGTLGMVMVWA